MVIVWQLTAKVVHQAGSICLKDDSTEMMSWNVLF